MHEQTETVKYVNAPLLFTASLASRVKRSWSFTCQQVCSSYIDIIRKERNWVGLTASADFPQLFSSRSSFRCKHSKVSTVSLMARSEEKMRPIDILEDNPFFSISQKYSMSPLGEMNTSQVLIVSERTSINWLRTFMAC